MNIDEEFTINAFREKFIFFLDFCVKYLNESEIKKFINMVNIKKNKISYEKMIARIVKNVKMQELLYEMSQENFTDEIINKIMSDSENVKSLNIIPNFNVGEILLNIGYDMRMICNAYILDICKCAIVISMAPSENEQVQNSFLALKKAYVNNKGEFTTDTLVDATPIQVKSIQETMIEFLSNKDVNFNESFKSMNPEGILDASDKLKETLQGDKFKNNSETAGFLSSTLDDVKEKLVNLSTSGQMGNVEYLDQLQSIGKETALNMAKKLGNKNVDPIELINDTQKLAKEIMPNSNLDLYFNMIRKNILGKINTNNGTNGTNGEINMDQLDIGQLNMDQLNNMNLEQMFKLTNKLTKSQKKKYD